MRSGLGYRFLWDPVLSVSAKSFSTAFKASRSVFGCIYVLCKGILRHICLCDWKFTKRQIQTKPSATDPISSIQLMDRLLTWGQVFCAIYKGFVTSKIPSKTHDLLGFKRIAAWKKIRRICNVLKTISIRNTMMGVDLSGIS